MNQNYPFLTIYLSFKMNFLPKELEDIIVNYKAQMEHKEKFQSSLEKIKEIEHREDDFSSFIKRGNHEARYYNVLYQDDPNDLNNQLWVHVYGADYRNKEIVIVEGIKYQIYF